MNRFIEEAAHVIGINSVTQNGNEELVNHLAVLAQDSGMKVNIQQVMHSIEGVSKRQFNLVGYLGDTLVDRKIKKGLLLLNHLDTVNPGIPEFWTENSGQPFHLTEKADRLYGLGVADGKLDFLCKIYAIQRMRDKKLRAPVYLAGTCGEFLGMLGCRYLMQSFVVNPLRVLVGAPTGLKLVTAHKSECVYRVNIGYQTTERDARGFNRRINLYSVGKSAHAAHADSGVNALLQTIEFLRTTVEQGFDLQLTRIDGGETVMQVPDRARAEFYLTSHQFEDFKRFFKEFARGSGKENAFRVELGGLGEAGISFLPETILSCITDTNECFKEVLADLEKSWSEEFDPPTSSISLGKMNQEIRSLELNFDVRLLPWLRIEDVDKKIQAGVAKLAAKYPSLNIKIVRERLNTGLESQQDDPFVATCLSTMEEMGIRPETDKISLCTGAGQLRDKGFSVLAFGPGEIRGNLHGPNESVPLTQLQQAVTFYERMIEKVCL